MSYNLFLDDVRSVQDAANYMHPDISILYMTKNWVVVRNYKSFVKYVKKNGLPDIVSFDHDLADEHYEMGSKLYNDFKEKTGWHCAQWIVDYCILNNKELPQYIVHSMNPVGAENITNYLENYRKHAERVKNFADRTGSSSSETGSTL